MSLNDARSFVVKMREDQRFREKILEVAGPEDLAAFLNVEGLQFDQIHLVGAMAECMAQLEEQMGC